MLLGWRNSSQGLLSKQCFNENRFTYGTARRGFLIITSSVMKYFACLSPSAVVCQAKCSKPRPCPDLCTKRREADRFPSLSLMGLVGKNPIGGRGRERGRGFMQIRRRRTVYIVSTSEHHRRFNLRRGAVPELGGQWGSDCVSTGSPAVS